MFGKKIYTTVNRQMEINFSPEEIVKVMSDITITVPMTDDEYNQLIELISKYGHNLPKMLIKVRSDSGAQTDLVNFQMFYAGENQIAPGIPEAK